MVYYPWIMIIPNIKYPSSSFQLLQHTYLGITTEIRAQVLTILESGILSGGGRYLILI